MTVPQGQAAPSADGLARLISVDCEASSRNSKVDDGGSAVAPRAMALKDERPTFGISSLGVLAPRH